MKKLEMIKAIAAKSEQTQKAVEAVLDAYGEVIIETLTADKEEKISLPGVGSFATKHVAERTGKIMMGDKKGETWTSPACDQLVFKVSKAVKVLD